MVVCVESFVGEQGIGFHLGQQGVCALQIVSLAWGQKEADGISQGIDQGTAIDKGGAGRNHAKRRERTCQSGSRQLPVAPLP
jgi:hypothetical protein